LERLSAEIEEIENQDQEQGKEARLIPSESRRNQLLRAMKDKGIQGHNSHNLVFRFPSIGDF
jgi:hypothetical protein